MMSVLEEVEAKLAASQVEADQARRVAAEAAVRAEESERGRMAAEATLDGAADEYCRPN